MRICIGSRAQAVRILAGAALAAAWLAAGQGVQAQLQITEVMVDPLAPNDDAWEWIEIRNTGATEVDLKDYIIDRLGDPQITGTAPSIDATKTANTKIPAGGVAVLYDADVAVEAADYNDNLFRTAWKLGPSVPLIGVSFNFGGGLTNSGTAIGLWKNVADYQLDVADDGLGVVRVSQFTNAQASLDFRTAAPTSFPASTAGVSLRWNGAGSYQSGANWSATTVGTTSIPATLPGTTNNSNDAGNPGVIPAGVAPVGIRFTEIMYNPASTDAPWEWVEFLNNTGSTINFQTTPYVFDDNDDAKLAAANVTSGIVPNGTVAVLFNANASGGITISDMQAAWDPGGVRGTNFIPVSQWSAALGNSGDNIGLWSSYTAYNSEATTGANRTMANAVAVGGYGTSEDPLPPGLSGVWPSSGGSGGPSIYLFDLSADPLNGNNWVSSSVGDGLSFNAAGIAGTITIHPGGELGTPGVFGTEPTGPNANFNGTGVVDAADLAIWKANYKTGTTQPLGDADRDGDVDGNDFLVWQRQLGTTPAASAALANIPEPMALSLALSAALCLTSRRRR
jgi:hypothetical protein